MLRNFEVNIMMLLLLRGTVQTIPFNTTVIEYQMEICQLHSECLSFGQLNDTLKDEDELFFYNIKDLSNISCSIISNLSQEVRDKIDYSTVQKLSTSLQSFINFYSSRENVNNIDYEFLEMSYQRNKNNMKQELLVNLREFADEITLIINHTEVGNVNSEHWTKLQDSAKAFIQDIEEYDEEEKMWKLLEMYIQPTIQGIIFITGILGNILLVIIFAKNKNMLTSSNLILLNLAIGDIFSLIVNLPLFYAYSTFTTWRLSKIVCLVFRFVRHLGISLSVFSVTALSVQRYCEVLQSSHGKHLQNTVPKVLVVLVWFMACVFAIPHTIYTAIYTPSSGNDPYGTVIVTYELVMLCLFPVLVTSALTLLVAIRLSWTVSNTAKGARQAIQRVNKILVVLMLVFTICYTPFYLYRFLHTWYQFQLRNSTHKLISVVLFTLLFGNATFNPIAFYVVSHKFRYYCKTYIFQCFNKKRKHENTDYTSYAEHVSQD